MNSIVHGYLKILGLKERAQALRSVANHDRGGGFVCEGQPTYALWFYKVLRDKRCDVLGNSLAILTGMADPQRSRDMVAWIENHCAELRARGELALDLPPCFFPFMQPTDQDWQPRTSSTIFRVITITAVCGPRLRLLCGGSRGRG